MAVADCPAFHQSLDEHELLRSYFDKGYTYKDIRDSWKLSMEFHSQKINFEGS